MKCKVLVLEENEVIYLFEDTYSDDGSEISVPSLRVENINGKLIETLLPRYFLLEKNVKIFHITPSHNILITNQENTEDIIVKKHKKSEEVGINHYKFEDFNSNNFDLYRKTITKSVSSGFDAKIDRTDSFFGLDTLHEALTVTNLDYDIFNSDDHEYVISKLFFKMSENRHSRIKKICECDSENKM